MTTWTCCAAHPAARLCSRPWRSTTGPAGRLVEYQVDLHYIDDGPPITVLYHELAHVYDFAHDTVADGVHTGSDNHGVDNSERVAMGLPVDHDGDPRTPRQLDPRHPYDYTENALRDEIGAPRSPRY